MYMKEKGWHKNEFDGEHNDEQKTTCQVYACPN
jgi:hypothetical protein